MTKARSRTHNSRSNNVRDLCDVTTCASAAAMASCGPLCSPVSSILAFINAIAPSANATASRFRQRAAHASAFKSP